MLELIQEAYTYTTTINQRVESINRTLLVQEQITDSPSREGMFSKSPPTLALSGSSLTSLPDS